MEHASASTIGLEELVLLLLVADGPPHLRLADCGVLHRAVVAEHREGALSGLLPRLGHRPDPMIGRRVTGLDDALRRLIANGRLVEAPNARWRIADAAASAARHQLAALPFEHRRMICTVAATWQALDQHDWRRRGGKLRPAPSV